MKTLSREFDVAAIFGIDIGVGAPVDGTVEKVLCGSCNGTGKFIGRTGRVVGNCFACTGSGVSVHAGIVIKADDCTKCAGTGNWRPGRPCFACNGKGKTKVAPVGTDIDVSAISTAFEAARANQIKSPKLRLDTFTFSRAPDHGKNPGSIYVKDSGDYIGKVLGNKFLPTQACDASTAARVIAVAADPHKAAKAYGTKTGSCSCCGRELTNGISVKLGIGPICRDKYGWG